MLTREEVNNILKVVKPAKNLEEVTDIVEGGYLDSFGIMKLITCLCDKFEVEITVDDIIPANFNSIDAIVAMIETIKSR